MNISGCKVGCPDLRHNSSCPETAWRGDQDMSRGDISGTSKTRDMLDISDEARSMNLRGAESSEGRKDAQGVSSEKLEDDEELLHEGHDHSHDDDDDHDGLARQMANKKDLSKEELKELRKLQSRDREVRNHEQAHIAASGRIATSGPHYEYEQGPDGRRYAVGGSVNYNVPPATSPEEELRLAQQLRRMALAPMDPSPQDRSTAAKATAKEARANREIREERAEELSADEKPGESTSRVSAPDSASGSTSQAVKVEMEGDSGAPSSQKEQNSHPAGSVQSYEAQAMQSSPGLLISTVV